MARVLIADWSPDADMLAEALCQRDHVVEVVTTVVAAKAMLHTFGPNLMLLGQNLEDADGLVAVQDLTGQVPLLFMGADQQTRTLALKLGADAVVDTPVKDVALLDARIRVVVRRAERQAVFKDNQPIRIGQLSLTPARRLVTVGGAEVRLTPMEYALLRELINHVGEVISRNDICQAVWRADDIGRSLETHIWRIRTKLNAAGLDDPKLLTLRGQGF